MLITLEGVDGCGKTTLHEALANLLPTYKTARQPWSCHEPEMPRHSATQALRRFFDLAHRADDPRRILMTSYMLMDRFVQVDDLFSPGQDLLLDRYIDSTSAYQGVTLGSMKADDKWEWQKWVDELDRIQRQIFPVPALTFYVRVSAATALQRKAERDGTDQLVGNRFDMATRVAAAYDYLAGYGHSRVINPKDRFVVLDGEQSPEHVLKEARWALENRFKAEKRYFFSEG